MRLAISLLFLATTLAGLPVRAQTPDHLVGITRTAPRLHHHDHWNCTPLASCPLPLPAPGAIGQAAGGTGWDPVRSGAWVTNGLLLGHVGDNCAVNCGPLPIPSLTAGAFATGLDVVESLGQVLIIDNFGRLHVYSNSCPPAFLSGCNTGLGPTAAGQSTSGIASDEGNGWVFYAYANFVTQANVIAIARLANPCQILCQWNVAPPCAVPFRAITGLACDWGRQIVYATDGANTIAIRYGLMAVCPTILNINCCALPIITPDPMVGLAVRTGGPTSVGQPCANGACAPCPMVHSLVNDPNLGNASFALALDQAPAGSLAWCLIGTGPCNPPGVSPPPLCGPVFTVPLLGALGPNVTGGMGTPCSGSTTYGFPLPPWPSLAGWTISSQCVALCVTTTGTSIGTAVSNCLSFTLQGN